MNAMKNISIIKYFVVSGNIYWNIQYCKYQTSIFVKMERGKKKEKINIPETNFLSLTFAWIFSVFFSFRIGIRTEIGHFSKVLKAEIQFMLIRKKILRILMYCVFIRNCVGRNAEIRCLIFKGGAHFF